MVQRTANSTHFTAFRSAREEAELKSIQDGLNTAHQAPVDTRMQDDSIYFSRRAREERRASVNGSCRKSRQVHLELAEAYELCAHLITQDVRRRDMAQPSYAL
jgi:hypothetical protein